MNQVFRDAISAVRSLGMYVSEFVQNHREEDVDVDKAGDFRAILGLPLARLVGGSRHRFLIYKVEGEIDGWYLREMICSGSGLGDLAIYHVFV